MIVLLFSIVYIDTMHVDEIIIAETVVLNLMSFVYEPPTLSSITILP